MPDSALPTNLTNSFWETYVRPQLVTACLSTARPSAVEGRMIWEVDTQRLRIRKGGEWDLVWDSNGPTYEGVTDEFKDADERQFIRADVGRVSPVLIEAASQTVSTDGSGDFSVTFPEAFTTAPEVTANITTIASNFIIIHTRTATGFTGRIYTATGAALTSSSRGISWIAYGAKSTT